MSMTDGHLYFDSELFAKGRRPAINPFLSVTRVGRQTQSPLRRELTRELISFLTLNEKVQSLVHFGADLNISIKNTIATGERLIAFFDQLTHSTIDLNLQIYLYNLIWIDNWHNVPVPIMKADIQQIIDAYQTNTQMHQAIDELIAKATSFNTFLNDVRNTQASILKLGNITIHTAPTPVIPVPTPAAPQPVTEKALNT